jgi:hypothetical protein
MNTSKNIACPGICVTDTDTDFDFLYFLNNLPFNVMELILRYSINLRNYSLFSKLFKKINENAPSLRNDFTTKLFNSRCIKEQLHYIDFRDKDGSNLILFGSVINRLFDENKLFITVQWDYLERIIDQQKLKQVIRICNLMGQGPHLINMNQKQNINIVFEVKAQYLCNPNKYNMFTLRCNGICTIKASPVFLPSETKLNEFLKKQGRL